MTIVICSTLFILFSCKGNRDDDFLPPPPVCDTCGVPDSNLKVVWQYPLWTDTGAYNCNTPVYWNGRILFTVDELENHREILRMRDASTGFLLWEWNDHIGVIGEIYETFVRNDKLLLCSTHEVYAINLYDGKTIWAYKNPNGCGLPTMNVFGEYVFHEHHPCGLHNPDSYLVRAHVNTGIWDTIYHVKMQDGYRPHLYPPGFWVSPVNDTILVFQNRQWHFSPNDGKIDLIAYNMTQDSMLYELSDLDPQGDSNVHPPLIWEDKIYFAGKRTMYCIDVLTGDILWKKLFAGSGETLYTCNWLVVEDKLIVKPDNQNIYALDPLTGLIIAAMLMHPSKTLAEIDTKFVLKKFKQKGFARGANREQILACEKISIPLDDFVNIVLKAMQEINEELTG